MGVSLDVVGQDTSYSPEITSDKDDYLPGEIATITGTGWIQDQTVELHIEEDPYYGDAYFFESIPVDENGSWSVQIQIEERHLGVAFTAYAIGHSSGATAYTYFTDGNIQGNASGLPNGENLSFTYSWTSGGGSPAIRSFTTSGTSTTVGTNSNPVTFSINNNFLTIGGEKFQLINYSVVKTQTTGGGQNQTTTIIFNETGINRQFDPGNGNNFTTLTTANYAKLTADSQTTTFGNSILLTSTLSAAGDVNVAGIEITFYLNNVSVGTASTNSNGEAVLNVGVLDAGTYNISLSSAGAELNAAATSTESYYGILEENSNAGVLTVNKAPLAVTALAEDITYGDVAPTVTVEYSGFVNGEDATVLDDTGFDLGTDYSQFDAVDTYNTTIAIGTAEDNNYNFTPLNTSTFEVGQKALTVTADNQSKTYGDSFTFDGTEFTTSGLVSSDAVSSATITSAGAAATATVDGSPYAINISSASGTGLANYDISYVAGSFAVGKKALAVTALAEDITYGDVAPTVTVEYSGFVNGEDATVLDDTGFDLGTDYSQFDAVDTYNTTIAIGTAEDNNYNFTPLNTSTFEVGQKALTVTADDLSKFCGQTITFNGTEFTQVGLVSGDAITSATISSIGASSSANSTDYVITISGAIGTGLSNYNINYVPGTLTVNAVTLDVTNAQNPRSINEDVIIQIRVKDGLTDISDVLVTLKVGTIPTIATSIDGIATFNLGKLAADLYPVTAQAGGCSESEVVFLPVYDPNGGFVTGGGWINSPQGAMTGDKADVEGKANFGFNAKYKTGKNNTSEVDGNTNFQFKAGDLHFSSSEHDAMQLVISGAKATYTGTGTVNGAGNHKFRVIAIDGQVSGGGGVDKFRIMIWDDNSSSSLLYDNKRGISESSDDASEIGGGSIVIHKPVGKGNKRVSAELITADWNTPIEEIKLTVDKMSSTWFESRKIPMTLDASNYDPLTPGYYELKVGLAENEFYELEEPIAINVFVLDKPMAQDITISNDLLPKDIRNGQVIGTLSTIDPVDDIHTYSIAENEHVELSGDQLIWRGSTVPAAEITVQVMSTDRAGQTISRGIKLRKELKPGEFFMYPNPASTETNIMLDLDESATVAFQVYDAIGRLVIQDEVYKDGSFTHTIKVDGLAPGMYTVQLKVGDMVMTKRLIKK